MKNTQAKKDVEKIIEVVGTTLKKYRCCNFPSERASAIYFLTVLDKQGCCVLLKEKIDKLVNSIDEEE